MFALLSAVLGFMAPFLPEVIKLFTRRQDNAHEIEMFKLRLQATEKEHMYKMEEINTKADIAETIELHKPQQSFGVQMLDAAKGHSMSGWALYPTFYLFSFLDFVNGMVRPIIAYAMVFFYMAYKYACYDAMRSVSDESFTWSEGILKLWTENDWGVLLMVLAYFFGQRTAKASFGGSTQTAKAGA